MRAKNVPVVAIAKVSNAARKISLIFCMFGGNICTVHDAIFGRPRASFSKSIWDSRQKTTKKAAHTTRSNVLTRLSRRNNSKRGS